VSEKTHLFLILAKIDGKYSNIDDYLTKRLKINNKKKK